MLNLNRSKIDVLLVIIRNPAIWAIAAMAVECEVAGAQTRDCPKALQEQYPPHASWPQPDNHGMTLQFHELHISGAMLRILLRLSH